MKQEPILALESVDFAYSPGKRVLKNVSLKVYAGQTTGLVGESGSGKSTLARVSMGFLKPQTGHLQKARTLTMQIVFQEPAQSLDPMMTIGDSLAEPLRIHGMRSRSELNREISRLLNLVELDDSYRLRRPSQLSGGECQRVAIARALSVDPALLVCDEAVSSLDALVQIQILNLLTRIQRQRAIAYLFISHDLRVVRHMSDWLAVMKDGELVEQAEAGKIFKAPSHPYTRELIQLSLQSA